MKRPGDTKFDMGITGEFFPDYDLTVRADVFDSHGAPISGDIWDVYFDLEYNESGIADATEVLSCDGSCYHTFEEVANLPARSPKDFVMRANVRKNLINTDVSGELTIPLGIGLPASAISF